MTPILEVKNLNKTFAQSNREIAAVKNVSFRMFPGETLGIIGESGSGKTTLGNLIARLTEPTGGEIFLDGEDITSLKGKALRKAYTAMQMVFQNPVDSFDPRQTLGDGIGESLRNAGLSRQETRERAASLLEQCGLSRDFAQRYPHQVSGGQCQRAAIARALAIRPKLLLCDEATSALDVTVQKEIIDLLKSLQESQKDLSVLFICHDISLVQSFCHRVLVMYRGEIVEEGTPDAVICRPKNEYTRRLIDSVL